MIIGGGIYEKPEDAMSAAFAAVGAGIGFCVLPPSINANGWCWQADLSRKDLHAIAQRTKDPSTLNPQLLAGMKAQKVGPWMEGVQTAFRDMFGEMTEPEWERTTDENGGRIFRKIEKEPPLIALMDDASTVAIRRRMIEEGRRGPITNEDAEKELFRK